LWRDAYLRKRIEKSKGAFPFSAFPEEPRFKVGDMMQRTVIRNRKGKTRSRGRFSGEWRGEEKRLVLSLGSGKKFKGGEDGGRKYVEEGSAPEYSKAGQV